MALDGLYPNDTFNLITFAGDTAILFDKPVPATKGNLAKAQAFLESRQGGGGTEMMKAIKASLDPSDSQEHFRIVCFMTDGEIGNDGEILSEIKKHPNARVFSFGIGSSINRFLLQKMADEGRGEAEFVSLQDDGSKAAKRFHERIRNPLLTDISIDWNGLEVADVYPKRQPDLFSAKPLVIHGRYTKSGSGTIKLKGKFAGQEVIREIPVTFSENVTGNDVLATLWARTRIDDLMSTDYNSVAQNGKTKPEIEQTITQLGLEYRLMTQFTSFVAVEEKVVNQNGKPVRIDVPVELPSGVSDNPIQVNITDENQTGYNEAVRTAGLSKIPVKGNLFKRKLPVKQTAGRGSGSGVGYGVGPSATPVPPAKLISSGVLNGKATNLPKPGYPAAAKAVSAGGSVTVQVVIDENGNVLSSSATSGHPLLRQAAEQASKASTFSPTLLSGQKVKTVGIIVYNFQPGSGSSTVTEGVRSVSDEPPLSPEEQKLVRIAEKSHTWVYDLILRLEKGSNPPTANEAYFVKDGKAEIQIQLSSTSAEVVEKLKMLGFEISQEKQQLVLHGRISIEKISQLAEIEEVRFILPNVK
jgi:TonB family protein